MKKIFFCNKSGAIIDFWSLCPLLCIVFLFHHYYYFFQSFLVVLVKLSIVDVKQNSFFSFSKRS